MFVLVFDELWREPCMIGHLENLEVKALGVNYKYVHSVQPVLRYQFRECLAPNTDSVQDLVSCLSYNSFFVHFL